MYFFRIDKFLFYIPFLYYFIKNNKEYKYFKVNETLSKREFNIYFALIFWINIALGFIISIVSNIYEQDFVIERPLYLHIVHAICIAPVLEKIIFRGVIIKYGIKTAIISNSILFGLSHYNIKMFIPAFFTGIIFSYVAYKYSIKYSILIHFFINAITKTSQVLAILRIEILLILVGLFSAFLIIFLLVFFIIGLLEGKYKEVLSIFELNVEDRENVIVFLKNNVLYLLVIFAIVVSNLLFNYKIV